MFTEKIERILNISPIKIAIIGSIFFLAGIFGFSYLFLHWIFFQVLFVFSIGCGLIVFSFIKGQVISSVFNKLIKIYLIIFILSILLIASGIFFRFNFDSTYEIKYDVKTTTEDQYTLFLPLPSGSDKQIYESKDLFNMDSIIFETEYGSVLRVDSNQNFTRKISGICGDSHFNSVSTSILSEKDIDQLHPSYGGDCWVNLNSTNHNLTLYIKIDSQNDAPGHGYDVHINTVINGNGWHLVPYYVGYWVS